MERHFDEELKAVKERLLSMASLVVKSIQKAIEALMIQNSQMAEEVFEIDRKVDHFEIVNEEKCIELLALRQPMASDLRFLVGVIKINNDLERMGDHAVNMAQSVIAIADKPLLEPFREIPEMATLTTEMLRDSLDSFIEADAQKAKRVCERDSTVDELKKRILRELIDDMIEDPRVISQAMQFILVSRNLERIADLSTNISEEVIYITQARVIKHHAEEKEVERA